MSDSILDVPSSNCGLARPNCGAPRLAGLEWLRAALTLGVLGFHSAVAYTLIPLPGLNWSAHEVTGSVSVDAVCWALDGFIMPAFFLLAGFCSARTFARIGAKNFLRHRNRRLLPALALGGFVILPITGYTWFVCWIGQGLMPLQTLWRWGIPDELERNFYGLGHLWFVAYLWIFCVGVWVVSQAARQIPDRTLGRLLRLQDRLMQSFWMPFCFALPAVIALAIEPQIVIGFRQSFLPKFANLAYYAPCFAAGFWLRRCEKHHEPLTRWCEWRAVMAVIAFVLVLPRLHTHLSEGSSGADRWMTAGLFAVYGWLSATSLFGLCVKYFRGPVPRPINAVAEASLWIYLLHVPVVGLLQSNLLSAGWPHVVKFGVVVLGGLGFSLATYRLFVRETWLGRFLEPVTQPAPIGVLPPSTVLQSEPVPTLTSA